jgi:hypothetical protein
MPRRIEIELTSSREDGTWTWRAAGAREPRGTVAATVLPPSPKVGDVLKVDVEIDLDGIEITGVVPDKGPRSEPERLELLVPAEEEPLVTSSVTTRPREDRGPRRDGPRRDRPPRRDGEPRREGEARRDGGKRPERGERKDRPARAERGERPPRRTRPEPPPMPAVERPKAKRLRAGKSHRNALLESLPEEQRPIAEQVVLGGLPAVRQAIEKQNAERTAGGQPSIAAGPLLELAEQLVPRVRAAEWRDRAEAAQRDLEVLDLRDLRSVVSAADAGAKDEEARALAQSLREGLATRAEAEHQAWLAELAATLDVGRSVRALRLSSRPPKAGTPLPPELATRLTESAGAALTEDAPAERWVAVLDALAFSPVRDKVIPASLPKDLHADVRATIARLATRIPKIAHIFEIDPDRNAPRPKIERRRPKKAAPKPKRPQGDSPAPAAREEPSPPPEPVEAEPDVAAEPVEAEPVEVAPVEVEPEAAAEPVEVAPVEVEPEAAAEPVEAASVEATAESADDDARATAERLARWRRP